MKRDLQMEVFGCYVGQTLYKPSFDRGYVIWGKVTQTVLQQGYKNHFYVLVECDEDCIKLHKKENMPAQGWTIFSKSDFNTKTFYTVEEAEQALNGYNKAEQILSDCRTKRRKNND